MWPCILPGLAHAHFLGNCLLSPFPFWPDRCWWLTWLLYNKECLIFVPGSLEGVFVFVIHGRSWDLNWAYANDVTHDGHPDGFTLVVDHGKDQPWDQRIKALSHMISIWSPGFCGRDGVGAGRRLEREFNHMTSDSINLACVMKPSWKLWMLRLTEWVSFLLGSTLMCQQSDCCPGEKTWKLHVWDLVLCVSSFGWSLFESFVVKLELQI